MPNAKDSPLQGKHRDQTQTAVGAAAAPKRGTVEPMEITPISKTPFQIPKTQTKSSESSGGETEKTPTVAPPKEPTEGHDEENSEPSIRRPHLFSYTTKAGGTKSPPL